jgi:hypothetical protein
MKLFGIHNTACNNGGMKREEASIASGGVMYNISNVCTKAQGSSFKIVCGLQRGFSSPAVFHTVEEFTSIVETAMQEYVSTTYRHLIQGSITTERGLWAWPRGEGDAGSDNSPQAIFSGEVDPAPNDSYSFQMFLNQLAETLGRAFGQDNVYVSYENETWTVEPVGPSD